MAGRARLWIIALAVLCALPGVLALLTDPGGTLADGISLLVVGVLTGGGFVGAGLTVWPSRPPAGRLMVAAGLLILLSGMQYFDARAAQAAGNSLGAAALGVLAHLALVLPDGRARTARTRAMVLLGYAVTMLVGLVWLQAGHTDEGACVCARIVPGLPARPALIAAAAGLWSYGLLAAAVLVRRWLFALPRPRRHAFAPVALAGVPAMLVLMGREGLFLAPGGPPEPLYGMLEIASLFLLVLWPLGILAGFLRVRLDHAAVGSLAGGMYAPEALEEALGVVLHDPTLRLVFPNDGAARPPLPGSGRSVTAIQTYAGRATLIYDAALDAEPELVRSAAAVVRLAIENESMLADVRASRARIVAAADAERRRIERNLHDGAQQRLVNLAFIAGRARARYAGGGDPTADLDELAAELRATTQEMRELAHGLHPPILREAGLGAALVSLAERAPVGVTVRQAPDDRLAEHVEQAAYYMAAEAVANALKHAAAGAITISATVRGDRLRLEVADDGRGGAQPGDGAGLPGLADRAAALGGRLTVHSPPGAGTRVVAELPVTTADS